MGKITFSNYYCFICAEIWSSSFRVFRWQQIFTQHKLPKPLSVFGQLVSHLAVSVLSFCAFCFFRSFRFICWRSGDEQPNLQMSIYFTVLFLCKNKRKKVNKFQVRFVGARWLILSVNSNKSVRTFSQVYFSSFSGFDVDFSIDLSIDNDVFAHIRWTTDLSMLFIQFVMMHPNR